VRTSESLTGTQTTRFRPLRCLTALVAAAGTVALVCVAAPAATASATVTARPATVAGSAVPNWAPYETIYNTAKYDDTWPDYSVNFSARMTQEIDRATINALAKKIRTIAKYISYVSGFLVAAAYSHPIVAVTVAFLASLVAFLTVKKWSKVLAKFILYARGKFKGKGAANGMRFDYVVAPPRDHTTGLYIGAEARTCKLGLLKCGGPGSRYWQFSKKHPKPSKIYKIYGACRTSAHDLDCTMN
jgi:hypothetical protein